MGNSGNGGLFSKFQERLRKIRLSRVKKREINHQYIQDKVDEIHKVIENNPSSIRVNRVPKGIGESPRIKASAKVEEKHQDKVNKKQCEDGQKKIQGVVASIRKTSSERNYSKKKVGDIKEKKRERKQKLQEVLEKKSTKKDAPKADENGSTKKKVVGYVPKEERRKRKIVGVSDEDKCCTLESLEKDILDRIKEGFEQKLDELEVLESELYFLEKDQEAVLEMAKVQEIKTRIKELVENLNAMIEQYNLYQRNYYIDHIVGLDDQTIVDDIIDYRTLLDSFDGEKQFVREYKKLEEFQNLYLHLKQAREDTESLIEKNEEKIEEFDIRDKKYNDIKLGMVRVEDVGKNCVEEMNRQNEYFEELMKKVHKIDQEEYTTYHLRGIGELLGQSIRYMGLMMLSPLGGLLPGIGMQALATRRLIGNIYRNLHMEEVNHIRYQAIDFDSEINHKLTDVDYTSVMIDDTIKDIERLRDDFMLQYDSRIPGYDDTLKKIQQIHHNMLRNQGRVELIRKNLRKSKKLNEEKLIRVRELNDSQN